VTKEEFDTLKREPTPAATSPTDPRADVLRIIVPHLPRVCELLVKAAQGGDMQAAVELVQLWRWARERSPQPGGGSV
jgi:hypothetical protein